jgi:hypothetical protein
MTSDLHEAEQQLHDAAEQLITLAREKASETNYKTAYTAKSLASTVLLFNKMVGTRKVELDQDMKNILGLCVKEATEIKRIVDI